jgi:FkbM family methyltransferase
MKTKNHSEYKRLFLLPGSVKDEDRLVALSSGDDYWTKRIIKSVAHTDEPELWFVLDKFADNKTLFIDGGANIGLWSVAAAARIANPAQVIAVDPSSATEDYLQTNCNLNGRSYTILPKALTNHSGDTLPFNQYDLNAINSLHQMSKRRIPEVKSVETITVDDVVTTALEKSGPIDKVIVKLDIEKSEFSAIQGAQKTLKTRNALIVYEDHRVEEPDSELTAKVLGLGLHVYYVDPTHQVRRVHSHEELREIKVPPRNGYNFLACEPSSKFDQQLHRLSLSKQYAR